MKKRLYARVRLKPAFGLAAASAFQSPAARELKASVWARGGRFANLDGSRRPLGYGDMTTLYHGIGADIYMPEDVK